MDWNDLRLSAHEYPDSDLLREYVEVGINTGRDLRRVLSHGPHVVTGFEPIAHLQQDANNYLRDEGTSTGYVHNVALDSITSSLKPLCFWHTL